MTWWQDRWIQSNQYPHNYDTWLSTWSEIYRYIALAGKLNPTNGRQVAEQATKKSAGIWTLIWFIWNLIINMTLIRYCRDVNMSFNHWSPLETPLSPTQSNLQPQFSISLMITPSQGRGRGGGGDWKQRKKHLIGMGHFPFTLRFLRRHSVTDW